MDLLILAHAPTRILDLGLLPAAAALDLDVTILTDCAGEHIARAGDAPAYGNCRLAECDVFNPLAVARYAAVHGKRYDGVLAAHAALQAPAALAAAYLGLPGASWRNAMLHDQRVHGAGAQRRILDCADPPVLDAAWFPATVQPLEGGAAAGGAIVHDAAQLQRRLDELRHGYALVERFRADEEVYALDTLATPAGFAILAGSRIAFDRDEARTKRVECFMARPPRCDELLSLLLTHDLGYGRHHIEYALDGAGLRIREIHNGLHDDESEFALDDQLDGDLFAEVVKASLGLPVRAPRLLQAGAQPAAALDMAA